MNNFKIKHITKNLVKKIFPRRFDELHKNSFGKVLVVSGCRHMSGAVYFASHSSLISGCGLIYIICPSSIKDILSILLPEAIVFPSESEFFFSPKDARYILKIIPEINPDVVIIGPGLGRKDETAAFLKLFLNFVKKPLIIDADALNLIAKNKLHNELQKHLAILTPHTGEARAFFDINDKPSLALRISKATGCIVVLKDYETYITDGNDMYWLAKPNSALSKPGSGDVLCGIIAGLWAQKGKKEGFDKRTAFESAICGVFLHSLCGKMLSLRLSKYSVLARNIINEIPNAIKEVLK